MGWGEVATFVGREEEPKLCEGAQDLQSAGSILQTNKTRFLNTTRRHIVVQAGWVAAESLQHLDGAQKAYLLDIPRCCTWVASDDSLSFNVSFVLGPEDSFPRKQFSCKVRDYEGTPRARTLVTCIGLCIIQCLEIN